jgi:hypothetical protein
LYHGETTNLYDELGQKNKTGTLCKVRVQSIMRNHWQRFLEKAAEYVIIFGRTKGTSQL